MRVIVFFVSLMASTTLLAIGSLRDYSSHEIAEHLFKERAPRIVESPDGMLRFCWHSPEIDRNHSFGCINFQLPAPKCEGICS